MKFTTIKTDVEMNYLSYMNSSDISQLESNTIMSNLKNILGDSIQNNSYYLKMSCSDKQLCKSETCQECFDKSFASHPKSSCWAETNDVKPRDVFKSSHKKHDFGEFQAF